MTRSRSIISQFIQGEERREFKDIIKALAFVINLAGGYDAQHGYNVALAAVQLGSHMGLNMNQLRNLFYAGLLHDVGEVGLPDEHQGVDYFEWQTHPTIQQHPLIGELIVSQLPTLTKCSKFIRWHHEAWDGAGYPDGLKGDNIPIEAQIIGLCDIVDVASAVCRDEAELRRRLDPMMNRRFSPDLLGHFNRLSRDSQRWTARNFNQQIWNELGIDSLDIALLMDVDVNYFEITLKTFANVIDAKHEYTKGHSLRVAALSRRIAEVMGFDEQELDRIEHSGFLHDAGKVGIQRCILDKPGPLTDLEYNRIKAHPGISAALLNNVQCLADHAPLVRHHHERFDGNGYPDRLKGADIPIGSRVLAVADTYDAMTSDRAYRKGLPDKVAREEIIKYRGIMYDPEVVEAFLEIRPEDIRELFTQAETAKLL